ncbi:MAG: hypothetical protein ACYS3N_02030, partial [Planctomycetota bacterium]
MRPYKTPPPKVRKASKAKDLIMPRVPPGVLIWFPHDTPKPHSSEPVGRTLNSGNSAIQHVR